MKIQPLFLGNWKMNMLPEEAVSFADSFFNQFSPSAANPDCGFAAPFTTLPAAQQIFGDKPGIRIGAQNVHWLPSGAHTGEISALMLKHFAVDFVIIGHSERRQFYGETDNCVSLRAKAAIAAGLTAVVCIGETKEQFEAGLTSEVVANQLSGSTAGIEAQQTPSLVIAYEPVWAIGTGLAATPEIANRVHNQIREQLCSIFGSEAGETIPILYGGSTTPDNIEVLMAQPNINGALVGGVSLKPDAFAQLIHYGRAAFVG